MLLRSAGDTVSQVCKTCGNDTLGAFTYGGQDGCTFWCDRCGSVWGDSFEVNVPKAVTALRSIRDQKDPTIEDTLAEVSKVLP
jgi:hypothetical protein